MQMYSRRSALEVHEYDGSFLGRTAHFKMTSVIGHVLSIDFPAKDQNWDTTDPSTLFDAPTMKNESNPKVMSEPGQLLISIIGTFSDYVSKMTCPFATAGSRLSAPAIRSQGV